eukprot:3932965-Rhodomonas_salina.1
MKRNAVACKMKRAEEDNGEGGKERRCMGGRWRWREDVSLRERARARAREGGGGGEVQDGGGDNLSCTSCEEEREELLAVHGYRRQAQVTSC